MKSRSTRASKPEEPLIPPSVLSRTFRLRCRNRTGTAFSLDVDGRQYLLSAAHLVRQVQQGGVVELLHGGKWKPLEAEIVGFAPRQVDVAVLALKIRVTLPEFTLEPGLQGLASGQDVYYLGFPSGEWGGGGTFAQKFPTPFVKKATAAHLPDGSSPVRCLFLDGRSNPGFSGGPMIFRQPGQQGVRVGAVVSAFLYEGEAVYVGSAQLHLSAQHNPDLIVCYDIQHALDLITLNPIGFELKDS